MASRLRTAASLSSGGRGMGGSQDAQPAKRQHRRSSEMSGFIATSLRDGYRAANYKFRKPNLRQFKPFVFRPDLRTFNDAVVAFRTGAESLKRLFVSLTFVCRQRDVVAVEFHNHSLQLQSGFVGLNPACEPGQKSSAK